MGIAGCGLNLGVAQELANHRQSLAKRQRAAGIGMAQVVDAKVRQSGPGPDAPPGVLQVGQAGTFELAGDDPWVAFDPLDLLEYLRDRVAKCTIFAPVLESGRQNSRARMST